jgi:hypothetical protein
MNRITIPTLIVASCAMLMFFVDQNLRQPGGATIAVTFSRSEAGAPLRTIFDGLTKVKIPRSLESAALPAMGSGACRQQASEWMPSGVQSIFRLSSVYASTSLYRDRVHRLMVDEISGILCRVLYW